MSPGLSECYGSVLMLSVRLSAILLCFSSVALSAQQSPLAPHSMYEPPAGLAAASLAASTAKSPADLLTTGEKTGWKQTGVYAEVIRLMRRMEKRSPYVKVA